MYLEINNTGVCERKGLVQIRFDFFLETGEHGFSKHCVDILDKDGKKTGEKQINPFHNHFVYVDSDLTNEQILDIGESYMYGAFDHWKNERKIELKNDHIFPKEKNMLKINARLVNIKSKKLKRHGSN